jgi:type II pantothenate kinase
MILGLDIGASKIKGIVFEKSKILHRFSMKSQYSSQSTKHVLENLLSKIKQNYYFKEIAISGVGARVVGKDFCGLKVKKVDEIQAIGIGGLVLTGKNKGLIVNIGTGTAIVASYDEGKLAEHVGGTGIGGGTILGLSKRMIGIEDFKVIEKMAIKGDKWKVDLSVNDIAGKSVGLIPASATASNFGKLEGEISENDIASGIFNLVLQAIGVISVMSARAYNLQNDIVFVGGLMRSSLAIQVLNKTLEIFNLKCLIPENCDYCTVLGAVKHVSNCQEKIEGLNIF